jgi:hypothetical protein
VFKVYKYQQLILTNLILVILFTSAVAAQPAVEIAAIPVDSPPKVSPAEAITELWRNIRRGVAESHPLAPSEAGLRLLSKTKAAALAENKNCVACHKGVTDMHNADTVHLSCVDCHGGDATATKIDKAHVQPRFPKLWKSSANPVRSYTLLNHEDPDFIQFVNPGDLRIASRSCGKCHQNEHLQVQKSMMTHGCMLWGAALYNNGAVKIKYPRYGESYSENGVPQRIFTVPPPTRDEIINKGVLPFLEPLPRFQVTQPGNILRIFERGSTAIPEIGIPDVLEEPGLPRVKLSERGLGTGNRTDPVFVGLHKTRLLDPTLNFLGTNDHAGDYRSSGCTACHVVYANDKSPVHSAQFAKFGHQGLSHSVDPTIPKDEPGHPIAHKFTLGIPTSQCIVCHVHPGTNVLNSFLGFMWWDNETDGEFMYPKEQKYPTAKEIDIAQANNPEEASIRGNWSDPEFLSKVGELNPKLKQTQFADFNGHGWVYRAVFKKDRFGNLLDFAGNPVEKTTASMLDSMKPPSRYEQIHGKERPDTPVHMMDIHLEKGMHCVDCHFAVDNHGNTKLYGEVRAGIEITCRDCHGDTTQSVMDRILDADIPANQKMKTTGPASPPSGTNLLALSTPFGKPRFEVRNGELYQNSMVTEGLDWPLVQTKDTITPSSRFYNHLSHMSKTSRFDKTGKIVWGGDGNDEQCAHQSDNMSCIACHSSWNPSCFGCHLPQKANAKKKDLHFEGDFTRNYTAYNFQTLRDDVYMLARDSNVSGGRIGPARSACAIHVSSYNGNREIVYSQQQTVSSDGLSGIAFSTNVPHTVRGGIGLPRGGSAGGTYETKMCTDCHLSKNQDNNAIMAQLLMQGTNYVNFIGRSAWVAAGEHGLFAIEVTELSEPQAVIGSTLHKLAYPDDYQDHLKNDRQLQHAHEHPGIDISDQLKGVNRKNNPTQIHEVLDIQHRGEYVYAACGAGGVRIYDVAFIDHKGFSERIVTAPVSPRGQKLFIKTPYATSVASPSTIVPSPIRRQTALNEEPAIAPFYEFIYATDRELGLLCISGATLLDGNPLNNFIELNATFNPDGLLDGAMNVTIVGQYAYVCCNTGLVVVDLLDSHPTKPKVVCVIEQGVNMPRSVEVQFQYGFLCDNDGVKILDTTDISKPKLITTVPLDDAKNIYVARTYAYVSAGHQGLVILDVKNPTKPVIDQVYNADGKINDLHDVQLGITNVSAFAYLADGHNGFHVVQLTNANRPDNNGFSPRPLPELIASYALPHHGHALSISKGIDRDRAVDESGNQIAVFGRVGARPLNRLEQNIYLRNGLPWRVSNDPFDSDIFIIEPDAEIPPVQQR